ncbi:Regulator of G-protein signaling 1 [Acorus calamus]|uniref:Regulator of G-protein signaling 1 n=1 Tax=Acorus calamus TaxID=4465 RepID=A0AAV9F156_ACOCL|nr:Regulator of G-protein signaling 1 [Acorus calamus]
MASCAFAGGCPSDYVAIAFSAASLIVLFARATYPFLVHKVASTKSSGFGLVIIQLVGSFNLLISLVMSINFLKIKHRHQWQECYIWAVWFEGPLGFGLLMSCRIVQAFQLYYAFVKRQLPPLRSRIFLPMILLPWIAGAALIHVRKPMNRWCHMRSQWVIPVVCLHGLYVASLVGVTRALRHIEFRFHEFDDLSQGITVSSISIGLWVATYILNELHEDIPWLQVLSRFLLLVTASILVLAFFSLSVSQPLLSQMSLRKREHLELKTMSSALGIRDNGIILRTAMLDINRPLDELLQHTRFRQSFMAFADSCLAGESLHFYDEVYELSKIPINDPVRRVYMARYIIEKYIVAGSEMEVNISHRTRQEILGTLDLAHPNLFSGSIIELIRLIKMNLAKDYWSSMFYVKFKEESLKESDGNECVTGLEFSPRLSAIRGSDNPFHHDNDFH